jgi:aspartyl-tRNA(Asn)/glutamyl-tRNA(Gln) amidotransferase subunit A
MDTEEICFLSAGQLSRLIKRKDLSPVEVIKAHLERIEALEPTLNSFITLLGDQAMDAARQAEQEIQAGHYRGPLHGVPLGLKDLYYVQGVPNTSGSKLFRDYVPDFDCTIAGKFKEAGAILLGKLNLHQFAYGPTGENPDYGDMHNPWNPQLITGGSSGGSASAAAAGQCTLTMGSDTGGSIRIPSALCGLVGLKPTYGRLSRFGLTVLSWSLDHAGPMTRTVEDCALVMNAVVGYDPNDPATADVPVPYYTRSLTGDLKGLRVGVPRDYFDVPLEEQVREAVLRAVDKLGELGASVRDVSWPAYHKSALVSGTILMAEAAAYHRKLIHDHGSQLHPAVRLRIETGFFISAVDYIQAQRVRRLFNEQSRDLLKEVDIVAGPSVPITAFRIGDTKVTVGNTSVSAIPLLTQYTRPFNLNGFPAITVPCGFSSDGLPIGLQLASRPFEEGLVLKAAYAYEQATEWHKHRPALAQMVHGNLGSI